MSSSPGRPRAADAADRVTSAAIALYGERGWQGWSIGTAAQHAGLGKSSAYLRWPTKQALLRDAINRFAPHPLAVDTGSLQQDLIELAIELHQTLTGPGGNAILRLRIDVLSTPELDEIEAEMRETQVDAARAIVRRGVARGDVPASTPAGLLLNAILGGVFNYVSTTNAGDDPARHAAEAEEFCRRLVDLVLSGAAVVAAHRANPPELRA